jgi:hypothetical protein
VWTKDSEGSKGTAFLGCCGQCLKRVCVCGGGAPSGGLHRELQGGCDKGFIQ